MAYELQIFQDFRVLSVTKMQKTKRAADLYVFAPC